MRTPAVEMAERAERIRARADGAGAPVVEARAARRRGAPRGPRRRAARVPRARAWERWERGRATRRSGPGPGRPVHLPAPGLLGGHRAARAGRHLGADRGVLLRHDDADRPGYLGGGARRRRRGADRGRPRRRRAAAAYACCRPPGHHVTRTAYGGSCYLNNAAIAAARLRDRRSRRGRRSSTSTPTTATAPSRSSGSATTSSRARSTSIPAAGWFPHFLGGATSAGRAREPARTCNVPVPPGTRRRASGRAAVAELVQAARSHGAEALVLALGVDAAGADPESPLDVTGTGYREAGRIVGALGLPTVVVQEGGYDLAVDRRARARHAGGPRGGPKERAAEPLRSGSGRTRSEGVPRSRART